MVLFLGFWGFCLLLVVFDMKEDWIKLNILKLSKKWIGNY